MKKSKKIDIRNEKFTQSVRHKGIKTRRIAELLELEMRTINLKLNNQIKWSASEMNMIQNVLLKENKKL